MIAAVPTPAPAHQAMSLVLLTSCFHNQNTVTFIFPKTDFSPSAHLFFLLFLPFSFLFFPFWPSLPSPPLLSSSKPLPLLLLHTHTHTHTHTFSEHPWCVRNYPRCTGDTKMNTVDKSCPHGALILHCLCCSSWFFWPGSAAAALTLIHTMEVVKSMDFGLWETQA